MLATDNHISIPNWQPFETQRLGIQCRYNQDRFVCVKQLGWFVYVRSELNQLAGLISHCGLLGPFESKTLAQHKLEQYLFDEIKATG